MDGRSFANFNLTSDTVPGSPSTAIRPSLKWLVSLNTKCNGVRHLIVYDVSRFGRLQPEDKIYWERRFKKQGGIQIVYVKDDFRNDGSIGDILTRVVKHSEAHQFSLKLSEVTLRGAKSHAALGHSAGGAAPYGFDRQEIDPSGHPRSGHESIERLEE